jgi:RIO kinase 2
MYPKFKRTMAETSPDGADFRLDVVVEASGFKKEDMKALDDVGMMSNTGGNVTESYT